MTTKFIFVHKIVMHCGNRNSSDKDRVLLHNLNEKLKLTSWNNLIDWMNIYSAVTSFLNNSSNKRAHDEKLTVAISAVAAS